MLTELTICNFKSWENTGQMQLAPLTGLFGTNSSGKTGIIQFLLMLKQTVESSDRQLVLYTGDDEKSYVDLGTISDIIYQHHIPGEIGFALTWDLLQNLDIINPIGELKDIKYSIPSLSFKADIKVTDSSIAVRRMTYSFDDKGVNYQYTMEQKTGKESLYELYAQDQRIKRRPGRRWPLPKPIKIYGFPDQISYYKNVTFLPDFVLAFEELFQILNASDRDWKDFEPSFKEIGIDIIFLCPELMTSRELP